MTTATPSRANQFGPPCAVHSGRLQPPPWICRTNPVDIHPTVNQRLTGGLVDSEQTRPLAALLACAFCETNPPPRNSF
jgi:hypothetical protein